MTFEEIRQAALARLMEFTDRAPSGQAVPYRRIAVRQQFLFAEAARANPEYAGVCAVGGVVNGAADLAQMAPPVKRPEAITLVEVVDGGETWPAGTRITIVPTEDPDGIPPRARLRNRVIVGVGDELGNVASIRVHYPYIPEGPAPAENGEREVEMAGPYDELLVIDLTRELMRKALTVAPDDRLAVVNLLNEEEAPLLAAWLAHAAGYAPIEARLRG